MSSFMKSRQIATLYSATLNQANQVMINLHVWWMAHVASGSHNGHNDSRVVIVL